MAKPLSSVTKDRIRAGLDRFERTTRVNALFAALHERLEGTIGVHELDELQSLVLDVHGPTRRCVYFETWGFMDRIELDLFDGERILNVEQGGGYRNVWIEGDETTRDLRWPKREEKG